MGLVSDHLTNLLLFQIKTNQVVVWFDPQRQYQRLAQSLSIPGAEIVFFESEKGFFSLRRELEPIWSQVEPPKLLIYVPLAQKETHQALVEFTTAGVVMQPGQQPQERSTSLSLITRQALEAILPSTNLEKVIAEAENGQLTLIELDEIGEHYKEVHIGALAIIFKSENTEEIALKFVTRAELDPEILSKNARTTLIQLLKNDLGISLEDNDDLPKVRAALARYLLINEFIASLGKAIPANLTTFPQPKNRVTREAILRIVENWRLRRDLASTYQQAAEKVEVELGLSGQDWTLESLRGSQTFSGAEKILQRLVELTFVEKPDQSLLDLAKAREDSFWASLLPEIKLRWQMIVEACQVIFQSRSIRAALKQDQSAHNLIQKYIDPENAWCRLDTIYRRLERDEHSYDFDTQAHDTLNKLISSARVSYSDTLHELCERFIRSFEKAGFNLPDLDQQIRIFHDYVAPALQVGQTAYLLVDSFRYEMALELFEHLQPDYDCQLIPAQATPPTITEVGMAALLPGAEKGLMLIPAGPGKVAAAIQKVELKNRADRMKHLEDQTERAVILELNKIAPLKDKKLSNALSNARLAVITATDEIDGLWENQPEIARRLHEDVFTQLRRGIRSLVNLGFEKIIVATDHGFIAGDRLLPGTPIDPPGGETIDLHRRVWVGKGGSAIEACLRKPVSAFGLGGDLDLVTPYGLACFKTPGGSSQYFHGGLSLQELIIPILVISSGKGKPGAKEPDFTWSVALGSKQISTRFFSVTVAGVSKEFFAKPPRIRPELRAGDQVISTPVSSSYGYDEATRDIEMRFETEAPNKLASNTITLYIADNPSATQVNLYILDAETGLSLDQVKNIPIAIAF